MTGIGYDSTQPNYALKLSSAGQREVTHNRFVVPEWGTLRFNLHVPNLSGGQLKVSIAGDAPGDQTYQSIGTIDLTVADGRVNPGSTTEISYPLGYADTDTNRIGYGNRGFETFHIDVPAQFRGKSATLKFELVGNNTVYLDDVFFNSKHIKLGLPTLNGQEARPELLNNADNYLLEKPQFSLSYNNSKRGLNWMSWQLDKSWLGNLPTLNAPWGQNPPSQYPGTEFDYPWRPDNALPLGFNRTTSPQYIDNMNYLFDRGHMSPRSNRNITNKDQLATLLTTNLLPQHQTNNRQGSAWARLENFSKDLVEARPGKELYIIAGGSGSLNSQLSPLTNLNIAGINVPDEIWKVIVILEQGQTLADITSSQVIAVSIPNSGLTNIPDTPDITYWPNFITTVRQIELTTGLNLLSNLPDEIEENIETTPYSGSITVV